MSPAVAERSSSAVGAATRRAFVAERIICPEPIAPTTGERGICSERGVRAVRYCPHSASGRRARSIKRGRRRERRRDIATERCRVCDLGGLLDVGEAQLL